MIDWHEARKELIWKWGDVLKLNNIKVNVHQNEQINFHWLLMDTNIFSEIGIYN